MTAGTIKASTRPDRRQAGLRPSVILTLALVLAVAPAGGSEDHDAPWPWPVPVDPPQITATFMEGRSGGYHTGLDIRTMGRTGLPVSTPLGGSVVRIRTSPEGYGKALYLDVGGGRTLVFAHLLAFADPIQARIVAKQAATGEYTQQVYLKPGELTFEAGDVIALSGDTGVGAPHLHFEVRDDDVPINPIDFFEVPDVQAPVIRGVGVVPRSVRTQIEGSTSHGDTVRIAGPVGLRITVDETTGINGFGLMPRVAALELADGRSYTMAQDSIDFADRWQRGLELDRTDQGSRRLALFRHPANSHRRDENDFDGFFELEPGETLGAVLRVRDHRGQGAAVRLVFEGAADVAVPLGMYQRYWWFDEGPDDARPAVLRIDAGTDVWVRPDGRSFAGGGVHIVGDAHDESAPEAHDGLGIAFVLDASYVAFRRGIDVSVRVPGDPAEYTLNVRDRRGRWSPESGVGPDEDRPGSIRTRLVDTGTYRVVRDVTPPGVGPWLVDGEPVGSDVTLSAREDVRHGITRPRWPALMLNVADSIAGIDPEDVRVYVNDQLHPARPELEDDHLWIEWDVDPGPGTHAVGVEVADRLGNAATVGITVRLVE